MNHHDIRRHKLVKTIVDFIDRGQTITGDESCYYVGSIVKLRLSGNGITISLYGLEVDELGGEYNKPLHGAIYKFKIDRINYFNDEKKLK